MMNNTSSIDDASASIEGISNMIFTIIGYALVGVVILALIAGAILVTAICVESELIHACMVWVQERVRRDKGADEGADVEMGSSAAVLREETKRAI